MGKEFANQIVDAKSEPSGLRTMLITEGDGTKPKMGQIVLVKYAGYLMDGTMFTSNYAEVSKSYGYYDVKREEAGAYEPAPMEYSATSNLIPGFKEGMLMMAVGDKMRLFIPAHLAYGPQGSGPIPPNSDLVFDLEIVGMDQ
jgi:FKBP-type peptidyl-prolyl cis-trans isomerase